MSVESFIDTHLFVYLFDETDERKRRLATELVTGSLEDGSGCISYQVVQEALNVLTRKLGASAEDARAFLDNVLEPLWLVYPSSALFRRGLELRSRYGFGLYDSLIVAAGLEAGCKTLYSEDLQDGQRIGDMTIRNPLLA